MKKSVVILIVFCTFLISLAGAKTYRPTEAELEQGITIDLILQDDLRFLVSEEEYALYVTSLGRNSTIIKVSENELQKIDLERENSQTEFKFEVNLDRYYDLYVKLNGIQYENKSDKGASFTIKKIHERIPEGINPPYSCYKVYTCQNSRQIKQCFTAGIESNDTCRCRAINESECDFAPEDLPKNSIIEEEIIDYPTERNKFVFEGGVAKCLPSCNCSGPTIQCTVEEKTIAVFEESPGNFIIQSNGVNAETKTQLYYYNRNLFGTFNNELKEIKILPDSAREILRISIKSKIKNEEIELTEEGIYKVKAKKEALLFYIFPVNEKISAEIDSQTGELKKLRSSWWSYLASDEK